MYDELAAEEICKKLRPVIGSKMAESLFLKYKLADDLETKRVIEQSLNALYHKYLNKGLLTEKILLEPPAKELIQGDYPLGAISYADKDLYAFGLRENDWIRHVCVSGMSGSGKTNFAFQVVNDFIKKKKPFIIFDWKKSFRPLMLMDQEIVCFTIGNEKVTNNFKININRPPKGVSPKEWINTLADLITESFFASFGVHKLISETLHQAFIDFGVYEGSENYPTWLQIKDRLEERQYEGKGKKNRESEWLISTLRIAHALTFGNFGDAINSKNESTIDVDDLLDKKIIFELNSLNNGEKKFFCEFMLTHIYKYKKANQLAAKDEFKGAIIVDEAHNIFLKDKPVFVKESVTDMVYREIREYGIGLVCLDQHISKLSQSVVGNSACNIAFQQFLPEDVEVVSNLMQLKDRQKYFSMLPVGCAIVKLAERYYLPFLIKVPFIELKKEEVNDHLLIERMKLFMVDYVSNKKDMRKELNDNEKKLEYIFHKSGTQTSDSKQDIKEMAKRIMLKNHYQENLAKYLVQNLPKFNEEVLKKHLVKNGYKLNDIAVAFAFAKQDLMLTKKREEKVNSLTKEENDFLKCIEESGDVGVTTIYDKLGMSGRIGQKVRDSLIEKGLIELIELKNEKGWKKVLRLKLE